MRIDPNVFLSAILLHIPMIRVAGMCSVLNPYASRSINVTPLSLLRAVRDGILLDNLLSSLVPFELRIKRDAAASRQSGLVNLLFNLIWKLFRHRQPIASRTVSVKRIREISSITPQL